MTELILYKTALWTWTQLYVGNLLWGVGISGSLFVWGFSSIQNETCECHPSPTMSGILLNCHSSFGLKNLHGATLMSVTWQVRPTLLLSENFFTPQCSEWYQSQNMWFVPFADGQSWLGKLAVVKRRLSIPLLGTFPHLTTVANICTIYSRNWTSGFITSNVHTTKRLCVSISYFLMITFCSVFLLSSRVTTDLRRTVPECQYRFRWETLNFFWKRKRVSFP